MISPEAVERASSRCTCNNLEFTPEHLERGLRVVARARDEGHTFLVEDGAIVFIGGGMPAKREECPCEGCLEMFRLVVEEVYGLRN